MHHSCFRNTGSANRLLWKLVNSNTPQNLPDDLRCIIFRANPAAYRSLNDLRTALSQELETRENSQLTQDTTPSVSATDDILVPTAGALLTHSQRKPPPPQKPLNMYDKPHLKPCIYCDGKHRHNNCRIVKTTTLGPHQQP